MAILPGDMPITRDQVAGWIKQWQASNSKLTLKEFIAQQIDILALPDTMVMTPGRDNMADETPILDLILDDLPSYGIRSDS